MGTAAALAQQERAAVCDLFVDLGPEAPTLCEGWTAADLASHLVARERRPDSGPGLVWPPLARHTERVRTSIRDRLPWERLVDLVRTGPPVWLRPFDGPMNAVEFFVHTEDVRRARAGWEPRPLSGAMADALWSRVGPGAMARRIGATVALVSEGRAPKVAGSGPRLELRGDPGELTLFATGRQRAASVDLDGDPALAEALRSARLGI